MSKNYEFLINAHPNIYNKMSYREMKVYISEPEEGVNEETGILLIIPGFGANANSNVYKKMRSIFADKYNLVTIQCDYFGWEFMQAEIVKESLSNFNDMGLMQALDNITAVMIVAEIIKDNNLKFNANKIIAYGHSHGAYLAYLCNMYAPDLFSLIIDNSAWLLPSYIRSNRYLYIDGDPLVFNYYAKWVIKDYQIINLPFLYKNYANRCVIHSFHGDNDNLISLNEKRDFCRMIQNCFLHEITSEKVDNIIFKSNTHGLNADFLLLYDQIMSNVDIKFNKESNFNLKNHKIETSKFIYSFDYSNIIPLLKVEEK
ncbi:DUF2920 family protein [Paenibacillus sp. NFR01]|uniref:DUF2920 family protein n=1 Tax=Paenibacillus sp. NFR01 TaxID=1566279 RepID=UPI0008B8F3F0|nr:DUF2920 family protein [Paenibacillus sp. NFR01]SET66327.1 Protein of unknown function [Paenibacillus sp. NFR01]